MYRVDSKDLRITLQTFKRLIKTNRMAAHAAIDAAGDVALKAIRKNLSDHTYTQDQLTALDHPYAVRHGRILVHSQRPWLVHDQGGGSILRTLKGEVVHTRKSVDYQISVSGLVAEAVIQGTSVMLGRDTLNQTVQQKQVQKKLQKVLASTYRNRVLKVR